MHFDDRLATVMRMKGGSAALSRIQYRQLLDILGSLPDDATSAIAVQAHERFASLAQSIPASDRARILREPLVQIRSRSLLAQIVDDEPRVASAAIAAARLSESQWLELVPRLPVQARGILRHRRGLGPQVEALLERLGVRDRGLPEPSAAPAAAGARPEPQPASEPAAPPYPQTAPQAAAGEELALGRLLERARQAVEQVRHQPASAGACVEPGTPGSIASPASPQRQDEAPAREDAAVAASDDRATYAQHLFDHMRPDQEAIAHATGEPLPEEQLASMLASQDLAATGETGALRVAAYGTSAYAGGGYSAHRKPAQGGYPGPSDDFPSSEGAASGEVSADAPNQRTPSSARTQPDDGRRAPGWTGLSGLHPPSYADDGAEAGIGAIVRRIEEFRRSRDQSRSVDRAGDGPLEAVEDTGITLIQAFDFETDAEGRIAWAEPHVAPMVVGMRLASAGEDGGLSASREVVTGFRHRLPRPRRPAQAQRSAADHRQLAGRRGAALRSGQRALYRLLRAPAPVL